MFLLILIALIFLIIKEKELTFYSFIVLFIVLAFQYFKDLFFRVRTLNPKRAAKVWTFFNPPNFYNNFYKISFYLRVFI